MEDRQRVSGGQRLPVAEVCQARITGPWLLLSMLHDDNERGHASLCLALLHISRMSRTVRRAALGRVWGECYDELTASVLASC